jgi:ribonuclease HI
MKSRKTSEHQVTEVLNGRRVPVSSSSLGDAADASHLAIAAEVKSRKRLPGWIADAMQQAETSAFPYKQPVAVLLEEGTSYENSLVVMRFKDFVHLLVEGPEPVRADGDASKETVEIYTDGGCQGNPGKGAWAAVIYKGARPTEISATERETTNNRMELRAAIEGLKQLKEPSHVRLYSDSAYLINGMTQRWYDKWEQNGWKTANKKPVQNADLWRELVSLSRYHDVEYVKVSGHAGVPANERCHKLVQAVMWR